MSGVEELEQRLAELQSERRTVEVTTTREDIVSSVDGWLEAARAHARGASRLVFSGQPVGEHLLSLLAEDVLADDALAARTVGRLQQQGFGGISSRQKQQKLKALDAEIATATAEFRSAREEAAVAKVRAGFVNEAV